MSDDSGVYDADGQFEGREINILLEFGGAGNYYYPITMRMLQLYPGLTVNLSFTSNAHEVFRVKVLSNNIPDIFSLNQSYFDYFDAIKQGVCMPLEPILDMEVDGNRCLIDCLDEDFLEYGYYKDHPYLFGEVLFLSGLWYNKALLDRYDIKPPKTWQEMLEACEKLKQNDVYGFGYCGKSASEYALNYWFVPMLFTESEDAYNELENLDPAVWSGSAVKHVLSKMEQLRDNAYLYPLSPTLSNAEAQAIFIQGDFAFLPCGSWLENEMAGMWPEDFELSYLPFSGKDNATGQDCISSTILVSAVSANTKNLDIVKEFYRLMYTDKTTVEQQIGVHQNALIIKDFNKTGYRNLMNRSTIQVWDAAGSGLTIIRPMAYNFYPDYANKTGDNFNMLMNGSITTGMFLEDMRQVFENYSDPASSD